MLKGQTKSDDYNPLGVENSITLKKKKLKENHLTESVLNISKEGLLKCKKAKYNSFRCVTFWNIKTDVDDREILERPSFVSTE